MDKVHAKQQLQFDDSQPVLAVLGGSQGSLPLNKHFQQHHKTYTDSGVQILWQCGTKNYDHLKDFTQNDKIHLIPFTRDMGVVYSSADLIISRAGALALSELALMGKAMVLIPFPHSAGDHQLKNAQAYSKTGAAKLIRQSELEKGELEKVTISLINHPEKIRTMENQSKHLATPNATEKIVENIMEVAQS